MFFIRTKIVKVKLFDDEECNYSFNKSKIFIVIICFFIFYFLLVTNTYALTQKGEFIYEGIDISNWQKNINFKKVKKFGIDVVYIKASEGTKFVDPYLEQNYRRARKNNMLIGFYHFVTATTPAQARRQADFFYSNIKNKKYQCKPAMDYESFYGVTSKSKRNKIAVAFMKRLSKLTNQDVIVYSNLNNLQNTFNKDVSKKGKLWLAYYSNTKYLKSVKVAWNRYIGIQYTSSGRIPGINGNVDMDRFSKEILLNKNWIGGSSNSGNNSSSSNNKKKKIKYKIKWGDTLWALSRKYGVSISQLVKWNNIKNPNLIYAGETLIIYK